MDVTRILEEHCVNLDSKLKTKREKTCRELLQLIEQERIIEILRNDQYLWQKIFTNLQKCINKEGERRIEEVQKKGLITNYTHPITELFSTFIRQAIREGINFDVGGLIDFLLKILDNNVYKRCYEKVVFKLLINDLLNNKTILCSFTQKIWTDLYGFLKSSILTRNSITETSYLDCLRIIMRSGPKYNFPIHLLNDDFDFILILCKKITRASLRSQQEIVVDIAYEFILHTAMDCRKACCKLGEEIFDNFLELYEFIVRQDNLKVQLIELMLLQIQLHHPFGSLRDGDQQLAYAFDWSKWYNHLTIIYNLILREIECNMQLRNKHPSIFLVQQQIATMLDSFVGLFVEVTHQIVLNGIDIVVDVSASLEPTQKRSKRTVCHKIDDLIERIQETKFWPWIDLTLSLIEKYPETITNNQFMDLLNTLANLDIENTTDTNLKYYLYKSFCILANLEDKIIGNNADNWGTIIKSVLRSIGMNHPDDKYIQQFIRILIQKDYINQYELLLQNYKINILTATENNLETLHLLYSNYINTNNTNRDQNDLKRDLIVWILENLKLSNSLITITNLSKFLIYLLLKQMPNYYKFEHLDDDINLEDYQQKFRDIQEIYLKISLEKFSKPVSIQNVASVTCKTNYCLDTEFYDFISQQLCENFDCLDIENEASFLIFVYITLSHLIEFDLINEDDKIFKLFTRNFSKFLNQITNKFGNKQNLNNFYKIVEKLKYLLKISINSRMILKLRELYNRDFLRFLFDILELKHDSNDKNDDVNYDNVNKLKMSIMEVMALYCYNSNPKTFTDNQRRALSAILQKNYNFSDSIQYEMIMFFLQTFSKFDFTTPDLMLPQDTLLMICNQLSNICECFYQSSIDSKAILTIFERIYKNFICNKLARTHMLQLLEVFYDQAKIYKPDVLVLLLKCMKIVYELSPNVRWKNNQEIILKMPEFLIHTSIHVRFKAIEIIGDFFRTTATNLENYHRQEIMFSKISAIIEKIFINNLSESSLINDDTTTTRISTVLQIYSTIMLNSNLWLQEALFELLTIAQKRQFCQQLLIKTIDRIAQYFDYSNRQEFLEKYLKELYEKWLRAKFELQQFPYFLLINEQNINKFHQKYYKKLIVVLMEIDTDILTKLSRLQDKTKDEIFEEIAPQLMVNIVIKQHKNDEILQNSQLFWEKFDEICGHLLDLVYDEQDFYMRFKRNVGFSKFPFERITVERFVDCLRYFDDLYQQSIVQNLLRNYPQHVHQILLNLKLRIANNVVVVEEAYRYFHQFTIIIEIMLEKLTKTEQIAEYLVTNLINYLLNLIRFRNDLKQLSCRLLKRILEMVFPEFTGILQIYFPIIISNLKSCCRNQEIDEILAFFLIQNKSVFNDSIFYPNELDKLEFAEQIAEFLKFYKKVNDFDLDNLRYLRKLLQQNKQQFVENLKDLQQLICALITVIKRTTHNDLIQIEAMRCLGEFGPINLQTLILQPEHSLNNTELTINELIMGHFLSLLSIYLFDADPKLIATVSKCLYELVGVKDAKKLIKNQYDFGYGRLNPNNFHPFCDNMNNKKLKFFKDIDVELFEDTVDVSELWLKAKNHHDWILQLCTTILLCFNNNSEFYWNLIESCRLKLDILESVLPLILLISITNNYTRIQGVICERIQEFFATHWNSTINNIENSENITINKNSIKCMLNVVNFVRLETSIRSISKSLDLNYLHVAKAASYCSIHFQALFYAELWCQQRFDDFHDFNITKLDFIYERLDTATGRVLHDILKTAYKSIGEDDALLGCGTSFLLDPAIRIEYYKELNQWQQITHDYNLELFATTTNQQNHHNEFLTSLKHCNLYETVLYCCGNLKQTDFESLWRLGQWNYPIINADKNCNNCEKYKFFTLKSINDNDTINLKKSMENLQQTLMQQLCQINLEESCHNFYKIATQLQSLVEIEDFLDYKNDQQSIDDLLVKWLEHLKILKNNNHFEYIEPIQQQHFILLKQLQNNFKDRIIEMQLDFIGYARLEKHYQISKRLLKDIELNYLQQLDDDNLKVLFTIEQSQLLWEQQDYLTAKTLLKHLCSNTENIEPYLYALVLKIQGKWFVDSCTENRETIIQNYFLKSLELFENCFNRNQEKDSQSIIDCYWNLSKFTDQQYQQIMEHIKSAVYQKKLANFKKTRTKLSEMEQQSHTHAFTTDLKKIYSITKRFNRIDEIEINNIENEKNHLLELALRYYSLNLVHSDHHNIDVFRLIALVLENRNNAKIKDVIETYLPTIPVYKFIMILPQIIPHISTTTTTDDWVSKLIDNIIKKCCLEHRYHTLPFLLALIYANKDREYLPRSTIKSDDSTRLRADAAHRILQKFVKSSNNCEFVKRIELLWDALIELAYYNGPKNKFKMPHSLKLMKLRNFDDIPILSLPIEIDKSGNYNRINQIEKYEPNYSLVGGITGPKRLTCLATNGQKYHQLLKKQDDLRQDAVMQQVFTIINHLLRLNKTTKNLQIRTYKVVPLSRRSGLVEWVDNSLTLSEYLDDAHQRYRPQDQTPKQSRYNYGKLPKDDLTKRLQLFKEICERIQPVFHKFFETNYLQPTIWYENRCNYIYSLATTSITGYILGVGDRHMNNILIDKCTAQVCHIDFGIAFEQGRVLPTPETVPFRLTRDIVDGMGVSGCEGLYRRSCERTLQLLRENYQTILTILEVLLYDPLYDWSLSIDDLKKRQRNDEEDDEVIDGTTTVSVFDNTSTIGNEINITAERALLRLKEKLLGMENGNPISVEHQVGILIQQAMDPFNLCRLYEGWQPFL